jgi:hypothetical protein
VSLPRREVTTPRRQSNRRVDCVLVTDWSKSAITEDVTCVSTQVALVIATAGPLSPVDRILSSWVSMFGRADDEVVGSKGVLVCS